MNQTIAQIHLQFQLQLLAKLRVRNNQDFSIKHLTPAPPINKKKYLGSRKQILMDKGHQFGSEEVWS